MILYNNTRRFVCELARSLASLVRTLILFVWYTMGLFTRKFELHARHHSHWFSWQPETSVKKQAKYLAFTLDTKRLVTCRSDWALYFYYMKYLLPGEPYSSWFKNLYINFWLILRLRNWSEIGTWWSAVSLKLIINLHGMTHLTRLDTFKQNNFNL